MNAQVLFSNSWLLWRPDVLLTLLLLLGSYFALVGPLRPYFVGAEPVTLKQVTSACTVLAVFYLAMGPLSLLAERFLFTARVLQMLMMTQVAPPLLFLAVPSWLFDAIATAPLLGPVVKIACRPVVALLVYNLLATLLLLPAPLHATLSNDLVHFLVQYSLIISSIFLWWPLMSKARSLPQLTPGYQLLYLLFAMNFMMPIAVFLLFSLNPWYSFYMAGNVALTIPSLGDQQVGALLMAVGMAVIYTLRAIRPFLSHTDSAWYQ